MTAPALSTRIGRTVHHLPDPVDKSGRQLVDNALPAVTADG